MKIIDRYVLGTLFVSFLICLVGLLSLYVLIDTLEKMDDFSEFAANEKGVTTLQVWARYYVVRIPLLFVQFGPLVMLMASMFATTLMVRHNELTPLLACGVSAFRVMRVHALFGVMVALCMMGVQEWVLPPLAPLIEGGKVYEAGQTDAVEDRQLFDGRGRVMYIGQVRPFEKRLYLVHIVERHPETGRRALELEAATGTYEEQPDGMRFVLEGGRVSRYDAQMSLLPGYPRTFEDGETYELTTDLLAADMIEPRKIHVEFAKSARELWAETRVDDPERRRGLYAERMALHLRFSVPLSTLVLLMLGLPLFIGSGNSNFWLGAVMCILVGAAFYLSMVAAISMGNKTWIKPIFAAWAPLAAFGSLGLSMLRGVRT